MKRSTGCLLLLLLGVSMFWGASPGWSANYYVRPDGGPPLQCNGTADAPASATPNCAWQNYMDAVPPRANNQPNAARIAGGDTLNIAAGVYMIGYSADAEAEFGSNVCATAYSYACVPQAVPSGPDAQHPTVIQGESCTLPPTLWGTQGASQIVSLDGSSNIVVRCLELTDHSRCIVFYLPDAAGACDRNWGEDVGTWAAVGIHAQDSSNVTLQDLNIHGFADRGVNAGRLSDWTVSGVTIRGNGWAGWDGDLGGNDHSSSNSGTMSFDRLVIAWSGCAEAYPDVTIINCWGQNEGGYGDGFAESWTGADWVFTNSTFIYSTQDGLDLLYANGTGSISIDHSRFARNAGNDLKTSGNASITNNRILAHCGWFGASSFPAAADACRAGGGEFSNFTAPGQKVLFDHNRMVGDPNGMYGGDPTFNGTQTPVDPSDLYIVSNDSFVGQPAYHSSDDEDPWLFWAGDPPDNIARVEFDNVTTLHVREDAAHTCGVTPGIKCMDSPTPH